MLNSAQTQRVQVDSRPLSVVWTGSVPARVAISSPPALKRGLDDGVWVSGSPMKYLRTAMLALRHATAVHSAVGGAVCMAAMVCMAMCCVPCHQHTSEAG